MNARTSRSVAGSAAIALIALATPPLVGPAGAAAQAPEPVLLTPARAFDAQPFSRIRGVHELPDGRVLVADQREEALYRIDLARDIREKLGRSGEGPGEYQGPTGLHPFTGDSVLLIDFQNGRAAIVAPDGSIPRTEPLFGAGRTIPDGADRSGRLYWDRVTDLRIAKRADPSLDRAPIVRYGTSTGRSDTLAHLTIPGPPDPSAFPPWDRWNVGPDGWVVIVRNQEDYRVDWVAPDGTVRPGDPLPQYRPLRVTDADRRALAERPGATGLGGSASTGARSAGPPAFDVPSHFPPASEVWVTWDGRAVVERYQHVSEKRPLIDVFDRSGRRLARYRLPEGRELVGTGPSGLFAMRVDEVGLQWLEVYEIPG